MGAKNDSGDAVIFRQVVATVLKELPEALRQGETVYREKLAALAALYARNYDLDVVALHHGEAHRRISLPTYPFARERYWIPEVPATDQRKPGLGALAIASARSSQRFDTHPDEIRIVLRWTGVFFRRPSNPRRKDSAWSRLSRDGERGDPDGNGRRSLRSRKHRVDAAACGWIGRRKSRYVLPRTERMCGSRSFPAMAKLFMHKAKPSETGHPKSAGKTWPRFARAALRRNRRRPFIGRCAEAGLKLGDGFRTIRSVWFGENEALARLELPTALGRAAQEFILHPGLMDGALQVTAVLGRGQAVGLPVPFAVAEVLFHRVGSNCYAHVRRGSEENGLLRFDISLLEDSGDVLAELKGLTMRLLRPNAATGDQDLIFVRPTWKEKPLSLADADRLAGRLLLFDTRGIAGE